MDSPNLHPHGPTAESARGGRPDAGPRSIWIAQRRPGRRPRPPSRPPTSTRRAQWPSSSPRASSRARGVAQRRTQQRRPLADRRGGRAGLTRARSRARAASGAGITRKAPSGQQAAEGNARCRPAPTDPSATGSTRNLTVAGHTGSRSRPPASALKARQRAGEKKSSARRLAYELCHDPDRPHDRTCFRVGTSLRLHSAPAPLGAGSRGGRTCFSSANGSQPRR
jgi:hypothetical protein